MSQDAKGCVVIQDAEKSLSNPYVFNTAISRSCTYVTAVGNPLLLLKIEKSTMTEREHFERRQCWSSYLKHCLEKGTVMFNNNVTDEQKGVTLDQIRRTVEEQLLCKVEMDEELLQVTYDFFYNSY